MSNVLRPGLRNAQFILSEAQGQRSRDNLTILSGQNLLPGQLCGIVTATGKVVAHAPAASDGSQNAVCLPIYAYKATSGDIMGAFITRSAELKEEDLVFAAGISAPQKAAAVASLRALGIVIRPASYV